MIAGIAVVRRERDADAGAGIDLLPVDLDRVRDDLDQPARQRAGRLRARIALQHRELVAAEPRDRVVLADRAADALRDGAQQLVADRMAERIVHALEVVEVETEHGERLAQGRHAGQAFGHALVEQHAVRQIRQRVVPRHVRDALLGAMTLGDVLVDRDPAALRHPLVRDLDHAPVGEMAVHDEVAGLQRRDVGIVELVGGDVAVPVVAELVALVR